MKIAFLKNNSEITRIEGSRDLRNEGWKD